MLKNLPPPAYIFTTHKVTANNHKNKTYSPPLPFRVGGIVGDCPTGLDTTRFIAPSIANKVREL